MAKQTIVQLIDDLDGESEAAETVRFAINGVAYEIDLTSEHAAAMREAFAPYVNNGQRLGRVDSRGERIQRTGQATIDWEMKRQRTAAIRLWFERLDEAVRRHLAPKGGGVLADRGALPNAVVQAYDNPTTLAAVMKIAEANKPAEVPAEPAKPAPARAAKAGPARAAQAAPRGLDLNPVRSTKGKASGTVVDIKSATKPARSTKRTGKAAPSAEFKAANG